MECYLYDGNTLLVVTILLIVVAIWAFLLLTDVRSSRVRAISGLVWVIATLFGLITWANLVQNSYYLKVEEMYAQEVVRSSKEVIVYIDGIRVSYTDHDKYENVNDSTLFFKIITKTYFGSEEIEYETEYPHEKYEDCESQKQ